MIRKLTLAAVAALVLGGCATDGYYGGYGGRGDYYYGQPSSSYYYDDGYGYYDRYGYGGYGGYGYPSYGYYGGYGYPYYPPYRPRPDHPGDDDDQAPNTIARPSLVDGGRSKRDSRLGGLRGAVGAPPMRAPERGGQQGRPRLTGSSVAPRPVAQPPRIQQSRPQPPMSGRSMPRPNISRPPASRERDSRLKVER